MGIGAVGLTVCCPTGVGNAGTACLVLVLAIGFEVGNLAFGLVHIQAAIIVNKCYTRAVIAAVFQSLQTLD